MAEQGHTFTKRGAERIVNVVRRVEHAPIDLRGKPLRRYFALEEPILAKITGNASLRTSSIEVAGGSAVSVEVAWKYSWTEVIDNGDGTYTDKTGGRTGTTGTDYALNTVENGNSGNYVWGVDVSNADYPDGYLPRPIGGGGTANTHRTSPVVELTRRAKSDGTRFYTFQLMGSHDGECDA